MTAPPLRFSQQLPQAIHRAALEAGDLHLRDAEKGGAFTELTLRNYPAPVELIF